MRKLVIIVFLLFIIADSGYSQDSFTRLENNGYSRLAAQLRVLPEIADGISAKDAKTLEKIVTLALKSSNSEVREAFELMVNGGNGVDLVNYGPAWNTQLQVFFWLAQEEELLPNDTLAQAIAISNGIWVAMGDDSVDKAVCSDVRDFLSFQRKFNPTVMRYPLEALLALSWRGNYAAMSGRPQHLPSFRQTALPKWAYEWITVRRFERMRQEIELKGLGAGDANALFANLEWYFYFDRGGKASGSTHWKYAGGAETVIIEGRKSVNHDTSNADYLFDFWLTKGHVVGDCGDETALLDALAKSWGVPTLQVSYGVPHKGGLYRHFYNIYFDGKDGKWKAYPGQAGRQGYPSALDTVNDFPIQIYIGRPAITLDGFLTDTDYTKPGYRGRTVYRNDSYTMKSWEVLVTKEGIPTRILKGWMLR